MAKPNPGHMTIRNQRCNTLIQQDIYRLGDLVFPFDQHLLNTEDMSETKRKKVKINLSLLKQAQISAIKIMIELKNTHYMNPVPIMTGKFFGRCLVNGALKKKQGKTNTKSIYHTLVANIHGSEAFAAIGKLERRGQPDVSRKTILRAVSLASLGYLSPHMHRSNIEIAVCAVRVEQQLAAWDDRPARPCFTCGATEQANHWRHIFLDCATAKMTWAAVYQGVMATVGMRVAMTEPLIQWSKLKDVEKKRMTKQQVKDTLSIISAGRSTLYRLYYAKIEKLNEMTLFDQIARSFRKIKNIARISGP